MKVDNLVAQVPSKSNNIYPPASDLSPTIFHEDWWLAISSGGQAREVVVHRNGVVAARLPYVLTRHLGMVTCGLPALTHFLGPAFASVDGTPRHQLEIRHELTLELISLLPACDSFWQKLHHDVDNVLAFQAEGFAASVQFSFEIPSGCTAEASWASVRRGHRRMIRDAQAKYVIDTSDDGPAFARFYANNMEKEGKRFRYEADRLLTLIAATVARGRGEVRFARGEQGVPKAAMFIIWDQNRLYYFLGTREKGRMDADASVLLIWSAMEEAHRRHLTFDFDGVYNAGQVMFYSGFGGRVVPRYIVSRSTKVCRLIYGLRDLARGPKEHLF